MLVKRGSLGEAARVRPRRGDLSGQTQVPQNPLRDSGRLDEREQAQPPAAARARQHQSMTDDGSSLALAVWCYGNLSIWSR